jgi:type II secretory pathway pseudopilin PulG
MKLFSPPARTAGRGYTLVQMMVAVTIVIGMAALGYPAFQNWIQRTRVEGFGQSMVGLLRMARSRAVLEGVPVVVAADVDGERVQAFLDRNGATAGSPSDGTFNPVDGVPAGSTDQWLADSPMPVGVRFVAPRSEPIVSGFTSVSGRRVAIFLPGGSVQDSGAIRFGDQWGNYLEVRVSTPATGRVTMRKYHPRATGGAPGDWRDGEEGPWEWEWGKCGRGAP